MVEQETQDAGTDQAGQKQRDREKRQWQATKDRKPLFDLNEFQEYQKYIMHLEDDPHAFESKPLMFKLADLQAHREADSGDIIYTYEGEGIKEELFRDKGRSIVAKSPTRDAVVGMLELASQKYPNGFKVYGNPEFQLAVFKMAVKEGYDLKNEEFQTYKLHLERDAELKLGGLGQASGF